MTGKISRCNHVTTIGTKVSWDMIKLEQKHEECDTCNVNASNLWLCLVGNCGYIGCGESVKDHSSTHAEEKKHCLTINLSTLRIWCYRCECEVYPDKNNPPFLIPDKASSQNDHMNNLRQEAVELMEKREPSLMHFFVSKQWINRFNTFAEPGQITNQDFLCQHGGVPPSKVEFIEDLVEPLTQAMWEFLHDRFGGGPACNHLFPCSHCHLPATRLARYHGYQQHQ